MAALEGIRVLDLTEVMQGPMATQVLGDLGADVIKVERGAGGDLMRSLDRYANRMGKVSSYYVAVNRNKRSVSIDLKKPEGMAALHRLIEQVDVLVHNYRPAAIQRLGLSYEEIGERYPRLIYASASGFGEQGPLAHKAGQDMLAQSVSGLARHVGEPSLRSQISPVPVVDHTAGMFLAQGILAALLERERSGRGQKVSISLLDAAMSLQVLEAASLSMYRTETNWVTQWYSAVFETSDGLVTVLGLFRDNALQLLCKALNYEDLSSRPEFSTTELQAENKESANALLRDSVAKLTTEEALARFDGVDLLSAPMLTLEEALEHPQIRINGVMTTVEVSGQEPGRVVGNPVKLSRTPATTQTGIARVGENTDEVLRDFGFSAKEMQELRDVGAITSKKETT